MYKKHSLAELKAVGVNYTIPITVHLPGLAHVFYRTVFISELSYLLQTWQLLLFHELYHMDAQAVHR